MPCGTPFEQRAHRRARLWRSTPDQLKHKHRRMPDHPPDTRKSGRTRGLGNRRQRGCVTSGRRGGSRHERGAAKASTGGKPIKAFTRPSRGLHGRSTFSPDRPYTGGRRVSADGPAGLRSCHRTTTVFPFSLDRRCRSPRRNHSACGLQRNAIRLLFTCASRRMPGRCRHDLSRTLRRHLDTKTFNNDRCR